MAQASGLRAFPWLTLALVGVGLVLSLIPGTAAALEYGRMSVEGGQIWRPLTGQLVHWTFRMTLLDLGVILLLGSWLEMRSRKPLTLALASSAILIAAGLHFLARDLNSYRGSSGLASALFTVVALMLLGDAGLRWKWRGLALLALLLLAAKTIWEMNSGAPLAAGYLPAGVTVTPLVHLLGAAAGAGVYAACMFTDKNRSESSAH
jgi:rhomboid family GlyGly-CTERM serine protease